MVQVTSIVKPSIVGSTERKRNLYLWELTSERFTCARMALLIQLRPFQVHRGSANSPHGHCKVCCTVDGRAKTVKLVELISKLDDVYLRRFHVEVTTKT